MKVLHVSPVAFGAGGIVGGGERYPLELARAMARKVETRFVTFGPPRREQDGALDVRVYRPWKYLGRKGLSAFAPMLAYEIARADVIHCHQVHTFVADQCVLIGRLLGKPVFLTDHAGGDRNFNRRLRTFERATGFLLVSHFNAKGFAPYHHNIRVIHGGVDTDRFRPIPVERRRTALYAGRLMPYKGLQFLIEGVRPETEVRFAGASYHDDYFAHLQRIAAGRNVHFLGPLHGEDLVREYSAAGVVVLPSVEVDLYGKHYPKSEILGLLLLEAMACETPVVCSAIGGMPELVVDGQTGVVVPPGDSRALGDAVESLLDDPARARRMGRAGREHVIEHFTWSSVADRCLDAYVDLASASRASTVVRRASP